MQQNLRKQLDTWLDQKVIQPSSSPWSFGLIPVPKKNGSIRWVVDYRGLNGITIKDSYPLPLINESFTHLSKSKIFSAVDGTGAYHVVSIRPEDREKTAFGTPYGLFEFCRMPFGLSNAPSTYSRLVQKVLEDIPPSEVLAYLDDTCIHSENMLAHLGTLAKVFEAHRKAGLMLSPAKCQLFQRKIHYLGHVISEEGIEPIPEYVAIVKEWPIPTSVKEVRIFLGKVAYYRKFVPSFSELSAPLYNLLGKEAVDDPKSVTLDPSQVTAFEQLRTALTSAPILAYPDFYSDKPFTLDTDWSNQAIAAVLSQEQDGQERVICYGARKLTKTERNYSSNKGELLALIHFLKHWKYYLQYRPFIWRTDHSALRYIESMTEPRGMTLRWLEILGNFQFTPVFREGKNHGNADSLSRSDHVPEPTLEDEQAAEDEAICQLQISHIAYPDRIRKVHLLRQQEEDPDLKIVRSWITSGRKPERKELRGQSIELRQYLSIFELLYLDSDKILYRKSVHGEFYAQDRLCLPMSLQLPTIESCHTLTGGHMGMHTTQTRLLQRFYFPGAFKAVEEFVSSCIICQRKAGKPKDQRHTLVSIQDGYPFQRLSVDLVGPIRPSRAGNTYILTAKDVFTRWIEAIPTNNITAEVIAKLLEKHIFSRFGMPLEIKTDCGTNFTSEVFRDVCRILNISKTESPPYNAKSNPIERSHKDLNAMLKAVTSEVDQDWEEVLPTVLLAMRTARNRHTGVTPHYALFGREATLPVDIIYGPPSENLDHQTEQGLTLYRRMMSVYRQMRKHIHAAIERARADYKGKVDSKPLLVDDLVWLFTPRIKPELGKKLTNFWSGPWKVTEKLSDVLFRIVTDGRWNLRPLDVVVSIDRIKRYKAGTYGSTRRDDLHTSDIAIADEFLEQSAEYAETMESGNSRVSRDHGPMQGLVNEYGGAGVPPPPPPSGPSQSSNDPQDPPLTETALDSVEAPLEQGLDQPEVTASVATSFPDSAPLPEEAGPTDQEMMEPLLEVDTEPEPIQGSDVSRPRSPMLRDPIKPQAKRKHDDEDEEDDIPPYYPQEPEDEFAPDSNHDEDMEQSHRDLSWDNYMETHSESDRSRDEETSAKEDDYESIPSADHTSYEDPSSADNSAATREIEKNKGAIPKEKESAKSRVLHAARKLSIKFNALKDSIRMEKERGKKPTQSVRSKRRLPPTPVESAKPVTKVHDQSSASTPDKSKAIDVTLHTSEAAVITPAATTLIGHNIDARAAGAAAKKTHAAATLAPAKFSVRAATAPTAVIPAAAKVSTPPPSPINTRPPLVLEKEKTTPVEPVQEHKTAAESAAERKEEEASSATDEELATASSTDSSDDRNLDLYKLIDYDDLKGDKRPSVRARQKIRKKLHLRQQRQQQEQDSSTRPRPTSSAAIAYPLAPSIPPATALSDDDEVMSEERIAAEGISAEEAQQHALIGPPKTPAGPPAHEHQTRYSKRKAIDPLAPSSVRIKYTCARGGGAKRKARTKSNVNIPSVTPKTKSCFKMMRNESAKDTGEASEQIRMQRRAQAALGTKSPSASGGMIPRLGKKLLRPQAGLQPQQLESDEDRII